MPLSRLELVSGYGDQTLSRVRFVVHGTSNATDALSILDAGLLFTEGRPTISTNIVHAHDWTLNLAKQAQSWGGGEMRGEPGSVILFAVPPNYHVGYGIFTSAFVDRQLRRVSGAPLRYAASRKQLTFYSSQDTEPARLHVEAEVASGYPIDQHPRYVVDPRYLIGSFAPGGGFDALISQLDVAIRSFQPIDFDRFEKSFQEVIHPADPGNEVLVATAIRDVIIGTVESTVISRLRMMRWQGLRLLGYRFMEGQQEVEIAQVKDMAEQRHRMDEMGRLLASSSLFTAELSWLKVYVAHELELMRVELEGAELESLPD